MSPRRLCLVLTLFAAVGAASPAAGQVYRPGYNGGAPGYTPYAFRPYGYGGGYGAATSYSANANGVANLLSAQGQYNADTAAAAKDLQDARSEAIDNDYKWFEAYHQKREQGEKWQEEKQAAERARTQRFMESERNRQPDLLGRGQLDGATGELYWPEGLTGADFAGERRRMEDLFAVRARSGRTPEADREIVSVTRRMSELLKSRIGTMDPAVYIEARNFLERTRNEAIYGSEDSVG